MLKLLYKHPIWFILILALILRLPLLNGSFWLDEAAQALESIRPFSQQLDIIPDFQPPLLHYIAHFAAYLSHSEWWLRSWGALIPGLITIWGTYKVGVLFLSNENKSKKSKSTHQLTPLFAALLMAISSFHIFYSQELRPYSLPAMWATLGTLFVLKLVKRNDFGNWLVFIIISILGLYSSYLYPFIFLTQLLYLIYKKQTKGALLTGLVSALALAPWLPTFSKQLAAGQALRLQLPGWEKVVSIPLFKALALVEAKFTYGVMDISATSFFIITFLILMIFAVYALSVFIKQANKDQKRAGLNLLFFYLFPLITAWLVSIFIPVVRPKRLLFLMPYFFLLISLPLDFPLKKLKSNWVGHLIFPITVLVIQLIGTYQYYTRPELQREDWRGLKQEIIAKFPKNNAVAVFSFDESFAPWRWYAPGEIDELATGKLHIQDVENLVTTLKPITNYRYVLVFDYLRTLTDPDDILVTEVENFGYEGRGVLDYPGIGFVRIYAKPLELIGSL